MPSSSSTLLLAMAMALACLASFAAGACTPAEGQIVVPGTNAEQTFTGKGARVYKCKDGKPDGPSTTGSFADFLNNPDYTGNFNYTKDGIAEILLTDTKTKEDR